MAKNKVIQNAPSVTDGYKVFTTRSGSVIPCFGDSIDVARASVDINSNLTVRSPFNRTTYDWYRKDERIPTDFNDIIEACRAAYLKCGVVRTVIDMMTDFGADGLEFIHPEIKEQAIINKWIKTTSLKNKAKQFLRRYYRDGNVIIKRKTGLLTIPVEKQWINGGVDTKLYKEPKSPSRVIPIGYSFINPSSVKKVGGNAAKIIGETQLEFSIPRDMARLRGSTKDGDKKLLSKLPEDLRKAIENGETKVNLDMSKIYIAYYKKDDEADWGISFLYSILDDLSMKRKMQQADRSALDGIINAVRLWKLGDHKMKVYPSEDQVNRLRDILASNTGGGTVDLVWDSMLEYEEFYPPTDKILNPEKYTVVDQDILRGLGVPEVLLGGKGANFSNAYIQLKTLVERLDEGREALMDFLENEIEQFCSAMKIDVLPTIKFNNRSLQDENVMTQLLISMWDRNIISTDSLLKVVNEDLMVEISRKVRENKLSKENGGVIDPLSPLSRGDGVDLDDKGGRPPNTKDIAPRKRENTKPRTEGSFILDFNYVDGAIDDIEKIIIPKYLKSVGSKNVRSLTSIQKAELQSSIDYVICAIKPTDIITPDLIEKIAKGERTINTNIIKSFNYNMDKFYLDKSREPSVRERKNIMAACWAGEVKNV